MAYWVSLQRRQNPAHHPSVPPVTQTPKSGRLPNPKPRLSETRKRPSLKHFAWTNITQNDCAPCDQGPQPPQSERWRGGGGVMIAGSRGVGTTEEPADEFIQRPGTRPPFPPRATLPNGCPPPPWPDGSHPLGPTAVLGWDDPRLREALAGRVAGPDLLPRCGAGDVAALCWAFARLEVRDEVVWGRLAEWIAAANMSGAWCRSFSPLLAPFALFNLFEKSRSLAHF